MGSLYYPPTINGLQKTLDSQLDEGVTAQATLNNVTGVQNKKGLFVVDRIDTSGNEKDSAVREYIGYAGYSGNNLITLTRGLGGSTDQDHATGAVVEFIPDVTVFQAIVDALLTVYNDSTNTLLKATGAEIVTGTEDAKIVTPKGLADAGINISASSTTTFTNKTLISPKIETAICDTNGNEIIKTPATASAVNELTVTNSATITPIALSATGGDDNIGMKIIGKGTGKVYPALKSGIVACSGNTTSTSTTPGDITGATVTFTPEVACTAIITVISDLSSSTAGDIGLVSLDVDGTDETQTTLFSAPVAGYRATVSQVFVVNLTAAQHTIKLQLSRAVGSGTVTAYTPNTRFYYFLISQ